MYTILLSIIIGLLATTVILLRDRLITGVHIVDNSTLITAIFYYGYAFIVSLLVGISVALIFGFCSARITHEYKKLHPLYLQNNELIFTINNGVSYIVEREEIEQTGENTFNITLAREHLPRNDVMIKRTKEEALMDIKHITAKKTKWNLLAFDTGYKYILYLP